MAALNEKGEKKSKNNNYNYHQKQKCADGVQIGTSKRVQKT